MSGLTTLREATGDSKYDEMGECLKADITHKEWQWLSDAEKARYMQTATEPASFPDGS